MQRVHRLVLGASVLGATMLTGCMVDRAYEPIATDPANVSFTVPRPEVEIRTDLLIQGVSEGHLLGDIGPALAVDQAPERLSFYDDGYYAAIEAVAVLDSRVAMMMVSASNPNLAFAPGRATYQANVVDEQNRAVSVVGCTGSDVDFYDEFDSPADEVEIISEPLAGSNDVDVQVTARWASAFPDNPRVATSTFRLQRE